MHILNHLHIKLSNIGADLQPLSLYSFNFYVNTVFSIELFYLPVAPLPPVIECLPLMHHEKSILSV